MQFTTRFIYGDNVSEIFGFLCNDDLMSDEGYFVLDPVGDGEPVKRL